MNNQIGKQAIVLFLLLFTVSALWAQTMDTVTISYRTRKFNAKNYILVMFERVPNADSEDKQAMISRSYYYSKKERTISSVREYDNPAKPVKGTEVIYAFGGDQLTKVTVNPPKSQCSNCASEYFFENDSLLRKVESVYTHPHPEVFTTRARQFQSRLPKYLEWGYFEDETMVNGKKKKKKHEY